MNRSLTFHTILRAGRLVYHEQPLTRGARCISGGYSHDATVEGSVVSGTNPQRKPVRSYQKTLEDTWVEPTRDEFSNVAIEDGESRAALHVRSAMRLEPVHKESFAFQEWDEVRKGITRDFKTSTGLLQTKWDVAEETMEASWRDNPGSREQTEPYGPPEDLHPRPQPHSDQSTWRNPEPITRRSDQIHKPTRDAFEIRSKDDRSNSNTNAELKNLSKVWAEIAERSRLPE